MNKDIINKNPMFSGYASVFNVVDQHNDIVAPGAFKKTLANNKPENIKLLWQHNHDYPIGKIIKTTEDKKGLKLRQN
ncbi:MAG: HK97 family phage prohead protease [Alphaproteobacteria bacterium]|nr:HK97 family phage prohead protease [Alphaproteobacteria bacterium]